MAFIRNKNLHINKTLKTVLQLDDVLNILKMNITPSFIDEDELHDFWEMVYIESGVAVAKADNTETTLTSGELLFHKPGEVHSIRTATKEPFTALFISFASSSDTIKIFDSLKISLKQEQKAMLGALYEEARTIYLSSISGISGGIFRSTGLISTSPTGAQQLFRMHLEEFLISVMRLVEKKENVIYYETKEELDSLIFDNLIKRLKNSIYSDISIDELCNEFSCGRTYLSLLFKNNTGTSIMNYYNTLKIKEAKRLIKEEKLSLLHISEKLNFSTQYYFSRVFKRIEGITPTKYKASLKNKKNK